jgi:predicted PolB exonuclease-like 3'-5' exonuclease
MKRLVIDIETVGIPWEEHDPYVREYLIKGMSEAEAEEEKRRGALSPFTGRIVAIGVVNVDTGRSCAIYEVPGQEEVITRKEGDRTLISGNEKQVLQKFWEYMRPEDRFISFNGRQFDGPFLMIRSAILGLQPTRDLVGKRYQFHPNCDLREALNFQGTVNSRQMKFNLDLACKAFGVTSSKSDGMDGRSVEMMYRAGRYEDIATYCLEDVRATAELYQKLAPTIIIWEQQFRMAEQMSQNRSSRAGSTPSVIAENYVPSDEQPFLDSINATSVQLSASLDLADEPEAELVMRHQAAVFEKLVREETAADELVVPPADI